MTNLTRRSLTTGIITAAAAVPLGAVPLVAAAPGNDLAGLIKTHRAADRASIKALDHEQEMVEAYKKARGDVIVVPCLLGGGMGLSNGYDACQKHFAGAYQNQRQNSLKQLARVAPDLAEQARAVMDAKEAENREIVDRVFAEEEARREAFGLSGAERACEAAAEAESEAFEAVCGFRCRTLEEAQLKAEYLASMPYRMSDCRKDASSVLCAMTPALFDRFR